MGPGSPAETLDRSPDPNRRAAVLHSAQAALRHLEGPDTASLDPAESSTRFLQTSPERSAVAGSDRQRGLVRPQTQREDLPAQPSAADRIPRVSRMPNREPRQRLVTVRQVARTGNTA